MTNNPNVCDSHRIARAFLQAVAAGELPDELLSPNMTAWHTNGGTVDRATYQHMVRLLNRMCAAPLDYEIDALTAEGDRVVAEVRSSRRLINGEYYANTYVFIIRVHDGRITAVAEHYNALIAREKLLPLLALLTTE